ncbi:hypothetical protein NL676_010878 [Syzygium grande]|nr:hypothetical protein NL676_010878 [Syzygium grande]
MDFLPSLLVVAEVQVLFGEMLALRSMSGDECLGALNMEMIEVAQQVGTVSKFTGSGGAAVAFYLDGPPQQSFWRMNVEKLDSSSNQCK